MIILSRKIKSNGYTAYENWMFDTYRNEPIARHYINNKKGTYYQKLGTRFFETKEEGNEFYKKKLAEGFTKTGGKQK